MPDRQMPILLYFFGVWTCSEAENINHGLLCAALTGNFLFHAPPLFCNYKAYQQMIKKHSTVYICSLSNKYLER